MGVEEENNQVIGLAPLGYPVMHAGNEVPMQPIFFIPQYVEGTVKQEEVEGLVEKESCQRGWGGCKRNWGRRTGCCWKDDGRPFGTFSNFVVSLVFGSIAPLLAIMMVFGMETTKLTRLGALFGTANSFMILSTGILAWTQHACHEKMGSPVKPSHIIVPFIVGLVFLIIALKNWRKFLYIYRTRQTKTEEENVRVISQKGTCCEFLATFFISLLFPVIGAFSSIIIRRNFLYGRYGALSGFGLFLVLAGVVSVFQGVPPILFTIGLFILELSLVHFRRALVCVDAPLPM
jgi:hypothetical protein